MKRLKGVITAMVTPFKDNGEINYKALENLVDFYLEKGVDALFPLGTTGEMFKLTLNERKKIAETIVNKVNKRIPIFIHVGSFNMDEVVELSKHAEKIGATGIAAVTPVYFGTSNEAMKGYYKKISESVSPDFPIYLYNIPQMSNNNLDAKTAEYIFKKYPNILGVKYSYSDLFLTYEYLLISKDFSVLQGTDRCFLPALQIGCDGTVSGVSSVYPEPFVNIYKAYKDGNKEKAEFYQRIANDYATTLGAGANMAIFKSALKYRGFEIGSVREPQLALTQDEEKVLFEKLHELDNKYKEVF